jgi:serine/threonine-protein kinase HipA
MKTLHVYFYGKQVGTLSQDTRGKYAFQYDQEWLASSLSQPISQSLPLRSEVFEERECAGFFGGLLPEDYNRELIARNLGVTAQNDYAMLREIGGECAGAVALLDPVADLPAQQRTYHPISLEELETILDALPRKPLLAGDAEVRLSLAGAQNKLALYCDEGGFALPLHESPSSHIIKPEPEPFPGLVENENYCLRLARNLDIPCAEAEPLIFGKHHCLLVRRYDRLQDGDELIRLHQEDFCQALGIPSRLKYQSEGGPHLLHCFDLIRNASSRPAKDLISLFDTVLFNYLIGNNDAHAKNFSLLYVQSGDRVRVQLAPLYDLVCTVAYAGLSPKMAMKIGGKYLPQDLCLRHWEAYWNEIGFSPKQAHRQTRLFLEKMEQSLLEPAGNEVEEMVRGIIGDRLFRLHKTLGQ